MDEIQETLRWNEDVARKLSGIEREIADSPDPAGLFEHLVLSMETAFGIPFVWLSLVRTPQADALRGTLAASGLRYIDAGVSGGVWGFVNGFCIVAGLSLKHISETTRQY